MKELSIEEKAKAYDKAIERAKEAASNGYVSQNFISDIFPELKVSEDERIRRNIIAALKGEGYYDCDLTNECIAWLEKQGSIANLSEEEQNRISKGVLTSCAMSFIDYLDAHKYEGKMCVSNGECEDIENAFHNAMWDRLHRYYCKYIEKQGEQNLIMAKSPQLGEQKPAWSEWDEDILSEIIYFFEKGIPTVQHDFRIYVSWLKSLTGRYTWKPSDDQIKVCKEVYADILSAKGFDLGTVNGELNRLEEELKKLKG